MSKATLHFTETLYKYLLNIIYFDHRLVFAADALFVRYNGISGLMKTINN